LQKCNGDAPSLLEVRAALERIQQNTYGTCLNCDEEIGLRRLQAVPWTPLCIACQDREDRRGGQTDLEWSPARAA